VSINQHGGRGVWLLISCPVSSEMFDFTSYAHAQSNIVHIKYAEKTDD